MLCPSSWSSLWCAEHSTVRLWRGWFRRRRPSGGRGALPRPVRGGTPVRVACATCTRASASRAKSDRLGSPAAGCRSARAPGARARARPGAAPRTTCPSRPRERDERARASQVMRDLAQTEQILWKLVSTIQRTCFSAARTLPARPYRNAAHQRSGHTRPTRGRRSDPWSRLLPERRAPGPRAWALSPPYLRVNIPAHDRAQPPIRRTPL
jgi:hypothetical protein